MRAQSRETARIAAHRSAGVPVAQTLHVATSLAPEHQLSHDADTRVLRLVPKAAPRETATDLPDLPDFADACGGARGALIGFLISVPFWFAVYVILF